MPRYSFPRSVLPGVCILRLCFHQRHMHFQADIISSQGQVFAELWVKRNPPVQDRYASARFPHLSPSIASPSPGAWAWCADFIRWRTVGTRDCPSHPPPQPRLLPGVGLNSAMSPRRGLHAPAPACPGKQTRQGRRLNPARPPVLSGCSESGLGTPGPERCRVGERSHRAPCPPCLSGPPSLRCCRGPRCTFRPLTG